MKKMENKYYTWEQMVEMFPDKWVVVENAKLDSGRFIEAGELIAICDDNEVDKFIIECYEMGKKIDYERTTEEGSLGIINVEGIKIKVEA